MTTLAILADIHGNLPALEAVIADMQAFALDRVVVAGDLVNWGPFSLAVVERAACEGWAVIRGNNEFYLLDHGTPRAPPDWRDPAQWSLLPWLYAQLHGPAHHAIAAWPDSLQLRFPDAPPLRVAHGSPRSHSESIFPLSPAEEIAPMLRGVEESYLIAAHTHLPMDRSVNGIRLLNPGTVGVPLDGQPGIARYLLLTASHDGWEPAFRSVRYDPAPLFAEFARQRFVEQCGVVGQLVLEEFQCARLRLLPFLHWRAREHPGAPLTPDLLARFAQVDARPHMPPAYQALS